MKNKHGINIADCLNKKLLIADFEGGSNEGFCLGFENQFLQIVFDNKELQHGLFYWLTKPEQILKIIEIKGPAK